MEDKEQGTRKSLGFDLVMDAITLVALFISALITIQFAKGICDNNYKPVYSTCFVYIIPCVIESVRLFVDQIAYKNCVFEIIDIVTLIISGFIAGFLLILISLDTNSELWANILSYSVLIYVLKYAINVGEAAVQIYIMKKEEMKK